MKDERVRVITEILDGVKILKLFSWEESFINKIGILYQNYIEFFTMNTFVNAIASIICPADVPIF